MWGHAHDIIIKTREQKKEKQRDRVVKVKRYRQHVRKLNCVCAVEVEVNTSAKPDKRSHRGVEGSRITSSCRRRETTSAETRTSRAGLGPTAACCHVRRYIRSTVYYCQNKKASPRTHE
jgi:hypothetical protein